MDAVPQQATAVIREGDPSQSNPNKPDVKVNAAESANTNSARGRKSSNDPDKKKTRKKKTGKKQPDGGKTKKGKRKKHAIPTDESSDLSENEAETSSDEDSDATDDTEPAEVPIHKRASKKAVVSQKSKLQKSKPHHSKKRDKHSKSKLISKAPASDTSESDWDSSDSEDDADAVNDSITSPTKKKIKDPSVAKDIRTQVARELQRILQLAQTRSAVSAYPSLGGGLGGGLDAGLGLAGLNYPRSGRTTLDSYPSLERGLSRSNKSHSKDSDDDAGEDPVLSSSRKRGGTSQTDKKQRVAGSADQGQKSKKIDFKRVDQVWDNTIHNFKLQATAESNGETKYDGFCFHVRRTFDWEGKYKATMVDIKSKPLRECLQDVIGNIKGVSLVDETPKLDPNILFL